MARFAAEREEQPSIAFGKALSEGGDFISSSPSPVRQVI
jgi:hypothetical protein